MLKWPMHHKLKENNKLLLRKNCSYSEFFWSVFSRIRAEYRDSRKLLRKSRYSVRMREHTDQKMSIQIPTLFTQYTVIRIPIIGSLFKSYSTSVILISTEPENAVLKVFSKNNFTKKKTP